MSGDAFNEFVVDQLSSLSDLECRRMFGGFGIYSGSTFFGIIHEGRLYFKTDARTRNDYERLGMKAFKPSAEQTLVNYFEVPAEVLENADELSKWARSSLEVSQQ